MKSATLRFNCRKFKRLPSPPRLSAAEARQKVAQLLTDHLQLKIEGYAADTQTVCDVLVKASVEGKAIEGTCNDLDAVPTGHTVRAYLNDQLRPTDLTDIEQQVNAVLTADLPKRVWTKPHDLAIDLHDEPFYGKSPALLRYACRGEAKAGTTYFYRVASVYVIDHGVPVTLAVTFVLPEDTLVGILKRLLARIRQLGLRWCCLLLDKGFCTIPVDHLLTAGPLPGDPGLPHSGQEGRHPCPVSWSPKLSDHLSVHQPHLRHPSGQGGCGAGL